MACQKGDGAEKTFEGIRTENFINRMKNKYTGMRISTNYRQNKHEEKPHQAHQRIAENKW